MQKKNLNLAFSAQILKFFARKTSSQPWVTVANWKIRFATVSHGCKLDFLAKKLRICANFCTNIKKIVPENLVRNSESQSRTGKSGLWPWVMVTIQKILFIILSFLFCFVTVHKFGHICLILYPSPKKISPEWKKDNQNLNYIIDVFSD